MHRKDMQEEEALAEQDIDVIEERAVKLHKAYTGFIAAAIIGLISGDGHLKLEAWSICLWILSLPPLVSLMLLDHVVRIQQKRPVSAIRGLMGVLGYGLSNFGTAALVANFSWWAAGFFLLMVPISSFFISEVAHMGGEKDYEKF